MIYPESFENKIGFDRIRELIREKCLSNLGRDKVNTMKFSKNSGFLKTLLQQVDEFKQICMFEDNFPVSHYIDVRPSLNKIRVEGSFMDERELHNLKRSLDTIKAIIRFFKSSETEKYKELKRLSEPVQLYPTVSDYIDRIITNTGKIKDNASPELLDIRNTIRSKQASISKVLNSIMQRAQSEGIVEADASLSIRDGRAVIPVSASNKRKIKGYVLDESATGKTVYIEPVEIIEVNNDIKELEYEERREILKILTQFSNDIRPYIDDLMFSYDYLAIVDFIRAKALVAIKFQAGKPIVEDKQVVKWKNARHPLLEIALRKENKAIVPLNIELDSERRILLISGPNAGGKSVCLKTVGLLQYMFQCGMLIPLSENSELGVFDNIFIDIGDEQSIDNDLSTYSSHLHNMKYFTRYSNKKTLLLIDEFGTGTEPQLGGAIAEAVLKELNDKKAFGVITTHYTNLKHFASSAEGVENGAMMFDIAKIEPLFQLEIGKPGSSFAFEIARKIGLSEDILKLATERVGEDHINFDKHLRDIIRDKRYWETKRSKIKTSEKRLDEVVVRYEKELEEIKQLRRETLEKAKEEAKNIVADANKQIESTIRRIKEANAEKEKTREARKQFEIFRDKQKEDVVPEDEKISRKMQKLKEREQKRNKSNQDIAIEGNKQKVEVEINKDPLQFVAGDKVKLVGQSTVGEVMEVNGKSILVAFGNLITTVDERRLIRSNNKEFKRSQKSNTTYKPESGVSLHNKKLNFKQEIDVRGKRADEALQEITAFIDDAIMVGVSEVRILHGKGNGILREIIRDFLYTVDVVSSYKDEHVQFGGSGITIVKFDY